MFSLTNAANDESSAAAFYSSYDVPSLTFTTVFIGFFMIVIIMALSYYEHLNLERDLLVSSLRGTIQISLLGYILIPIFFNPNFFVTFGVSLIMALIAAREATSRLKYTYKGIYWVAFSGLYFPVTIVLTTTLTFIIPIDPFWNPQYYIPIGGIMMNTALNAVSIGLSCFINDMYEKRGIIESNLAMGATKDEAVQPLYEENMRIGLRIIINNLSVLGLVAIPGMMTGQIIGGISPEQAARYQIIIFYMITANSGLGLLIVLKTTKKVLFDHEERLCVISKLSKRDGVKEDIVMASFHFFQGKFQSILAFVRERNMFGFWENYQRNDFSTLSTTNERAEAYGSLRT